VEKMSFFQLAHMTKVSTQINSSTPQYDVYKVLFKKMSGMGPWGASKLTFLHFGTGSGLDSKIFDGFQVVKTHYSMLMTPYAPLI
jgi:hypothetical protein